jgi:demethylmenaquinone methyltransferase/2-methoxy-6-polyprenyl-1,4-benzoquinol methylase
MTEVEYQKAEKARDVRRMFGAIAGHYDFLNHFLSANIDRIWRRVCVREVGVRLNARQPRILDIGCGTGDLSLAFAPVGSVVGCDFSHPMLRVGHEKISGRATPNPVWLLETDALELPFAPGRFDAAVSAFVLRNLADARKGIAEMRRVLKPGGVLAVLDFSMPRLPVVGCVYRFYFLRILPRIGTWISGVEGPYKYLPDSVQEFPEPAELKALIESAGFRNVEYRLLSGGIAVLLLARA